MHRRAKQAYKSSRFINHLTAACRSDQLKMLLLDAPFALRCFLHTVITYPQESTGRFVIYLTTTEHTRVRTNTPLDADKREYLGIVHSLCERPGVSLQFVKIVLHREQPDRIRILLGWIHQESSVPREERHEEPKERLPAYFIGKLYPARM